MAFLVRHAHDRARTNPLWRADRAPIRPAHINIRRGLPRERERSRVPRDRYLADTETGAGCIYRAKFEAVHFHSRRVFAPSIAQQTNVMRSAELLSQGPRLDVRTLALSRQKMVDLNAVHRCTKPNFGGLADR